MAKLTITRGLPGSGKTTWAKTQLRAVRVNRDELRRMMHNGWTGEDWAERQITIAQRATIESLLKAGVNVISDDTNLRRMVVKDLEKLAAAAGVESEIVDFTHVSLQTCIQRDAERAEGERVGEAVIRRMHERYLKDGELPAEKREERKPDGNF